MTDLHAQIDQQIANGYWSVLCVPDAEPTGFGYTIGLTALNLPELLIVGIRPDTACIILNEVGRRHKETPLQEGQILTDVLAHAMPVRIDAVPHDLAVEEYAIQAGVHFGDDEVEVLHVALPDAHGRLPGDPDCDPEWDRYQTLGR